MLLKFFFHLFSLLEQIRYLNVVVNNYIVQLLLHISKIHGDLHSNKRLGFRDLIIKAQLP